MHQKQILFIRKKTSKAYKIIKQIKPFKINTELIYIHQEERTGSDPFSKDPRESNPMTLSSWVAKSPKALLQTCLRKDRPNRIKKEQN